MKKISITLILLIISIFMISNVVLAYNLDLNLSTDKTDVKVGDKVTVTLTLSQGMQAADFSINYDNNLLQFENASLGKNFYSTKVPGKITCSWFDTKDTTQFTFTFIAKSSGTARFTTTTENFYNGNLQAASSYNEGNLNITLLSAGSTGTSSTITNLNNNTTTNTENNTETDEIIEVDEKDIINNNNQSNNTQTIEQIQTKQEETVINNSTTNKNQTTTNKQQLVNSQLSSTYNTQKAETSTTVQNTNLPQTRRRKYIINYRNICSSNNCNNK